MVVQTTIDLFKEKCMDKENSEEFIVEMKKKMKEKFSKLKLQNEKESYVDFLFYNLIKIIIIRMFANHLLKKNGHQLKKN